jgi:hypothetical protein
MGIIGIDGESSIEIDLTETWWEGVDWIQLVQETHF